MVAISKKRRRVYVIPLDPEHPPVTTKANRSQQELPGLQRPPTLTLRPRSDKDSSIESRPVDVDVRLPVKTVVGWELGSYLIPDPIGALDEWLRNKREEAGV